MARRQSVPEWFEGWEKTREALGRLATAEAAWARQREAAARAASDRALVAACEILKEETGGIAEARTLATEVRHALQALYEELPQPPRRDVVADVSVAIWYERVCLGRRFPQIARAWRVEESWIKERAGYKRQTANDWSGIERVWHAVSLAFATAMKRVDNDATGAMRLTLTRRSVDARAISTLLAALAPDRPLRAVVVEMRTAWQEAMPPLRDALEQPARFNRALDELTSARVIRRHNGDIILPAATRQLILATVTDDAREAALTDATVMLEAVLDLEPLDPKAWSQWEHAAPHVDALTAAADHLPGFLDRVCMLADALSKYFRARDDYDNAVRLADRAIEIGERAFGPEHPRITGRYYNRAMAWELLGRHDDALQDYDHAIEIRERTDGDGPEVAALLNARGNLLNSMGRLRDAAADQTRGIAMIEGLDGVEETLMELYNDLAGTRTMQGRTAEAVDLYAAAEKVAPPGDYRRAKAAQNRADLLVERGDPTEALTALEHAEPLVLNAFPRVTWEVWFLHKMYVHVLTRLDRTEDAEPHRREMVAINDEWTARQELHDADSNH
jgi:tetratricopeptide (TPR) repeat protein